ncbi:MBL fold metallo-hydrolase [Sediminibacillus albus]|uniref:Glyoxylase, beta-lactamase superfamily II n=1 Tax=Sediminibacillus albus TaxID=407036 RepID=A0A1G9ASA6_9BACI|nr:MBL fold metallo-hydrolase [Sediminibacillus albus]SDK29520.1 Glyoxylase, beta-lactamase superfamily II [Sediminibacillus albus]
MSGLKPLTVKELAHRILNQEEVFILDIRRQEDYQDWKIDGRHVKSINVPFADIQTFPNKVKQSLPQTQPVFIVCYKGISAQTATALLEREGMENVTYLVDGITGWGEHLEPVKIGSLSNGGSVYQFIRLGKGCLSYMIVSGKEALVIDASRMTTFYQSFAAEHGWTIKHVADTHLHADHISGGSLLAEAVGADYWFPPADDEGAVYDYQPLENGSEIKFGEESETVTVLSSPGHTIGSTSFIVDNQYLLTGDTLFVQSIGRPDLAGKAAEWAGHLHSTLYDRFPRLPQHLNVLPTHFSNIGELNEQGNVQSTLEELYLNNERLNISSPEQFNKAVTGNLPPQPNSYQEIRLVNLGKINPDTHEQQQMEAGPNRCAVS